MLSEYIPAVLLRGWDGYSYFLQVYQYRCAQLREGECLRNKVKIWLQVLLRVCIQKKKILFCPEAPKPIFVIYKILLFLGYRITNDPSHNVHLGMKWLNSFDGSPFLPVEPIFKKMSPASSEITIVNMHCFDVSKNHVSMVFEKVFGYSVSVDPYTYQGKIVKKSNWNGLHVGEVVDGPVDERQEGYVYEKLLNNQVDGEVVEDIRVPVFKTTIPFVYLKYRPVEQRLIDRAYSNKKVIIAEVSDRLSQEEIKKVGEFTQELGLDYGEIDILRNKDDGKIYIVDVNNNPAGPPEPISSDDSKTAIVRLANAFEETFMH
ncbi:MAG: hypothetical protein KC643_31225 [Nitrospira sp.]|nr:hypothetical protein [Nitrospira sp.]